MLRPIPIAPIPLEMARVARAALPKGHRYVRVADARDTLVTDALFTPLLPASGPPALAPWRLGGVTSLPGAEGVADRQAADAVRSRIDWISVWRLELTDAGFEASVLSECRRRWMAGAAASLRFETRLTWCRSRPLVNARGRQRTDSTHLLAAVRALNRLAVVGEAMRHALQTLAVVVPAWRRAVSHPDWRDRDPRRAEDDRLPPTQPARAALALTIGHDDWPWLAAVDHPNTPPWRREIPAVARRRRVWRQHDGWDGIPLQWREADNSPPAARCLSSPSDAAAHDARQHTTPWVGDTVHLTETCDADLPHLITPVETTRGPATDGAATPPIQAARPQRGLLPGTHLVDTSCLDAERCVKSRDAYGVDRLGPTRLDDHWQARAGAGVDAQHFPRDWDQQQATCPAGQASTSWTPAVEKRGNAVIKGKVSSTACRRCDHGAPCVRSTKRDPRRTLPIWPQPPDHALQAARQREVTELCQAEYARHAGMEGTIARGRRSTRLRRPRDRGLARVHLGHILTAVGLHVLRLGAWWLETARAKSRRTPFARLMTAGIAASRAETSPAVSKLTKT
jgi:transposase